MYACLLTYLKSVTRVTPIVMLNAARLLQNLAIPLTVVHVVCRQILLVLAVQLSHSHLLHLLWYAKPSKSIFANGCAVLLFGMHVIFCVRNHNKTFDVQSSLPCLASC